MPARSRAANARRSGPPHWPGILEAVTDQRVNAVNADLVARERGLTVRETRTPSSEPWASLVELSRSVRPTAEPLLTLAGSTAHGRPHLAGLDGFAIDAELAGLMLVTRHHDRPGIVGAVGTILAESGINISSLELSRLSERGEAMMFVSVDESASTQRVLDRAARGRRHGRGARGGAAGLTLMTKHPGLGARGAVAR